MNELNIQRDSLVEEIRSLRDLFRVEVPSDERGLQKELEILERRAEAIPANSERDILEPVEFAFYDLVESVPELRVLLWRIHDAETLAVLRRSARTLSLASQRPLTESESTTLSEIQAEIDGIIGGKGKGGKRRKSFHRERSKSRLNRHARRNRRTRFLKRRGDL